MLQSKDVAIRFQGAGLNEAGLLVEKKVVQAPMPKQLSIPGIMLSDGAVELLVTATTEVVKATTEVAKARENHRRTILLALILAGSVIVLVALNSDPTPLIEAIAPRLK
ncbi:hypothetical protein ACWEJ6_53125 [Nonomuraea sp. NPDC004702]